MPKTIPHTFLSKLTQIYRVILFRSRARVDAKYESDIDLASGAPGAIPDQWQEIMAVLAEGGHPVGH